MANKGKKITLFDSSGTLSKDALLGYVFNELLPPAREEVERHLAQNEMYRDMVEGLLQIPNRAEVEKVIHEMNIDIAERSGSTANVPGLGENVGEFFWNYRRVAAVVGTVLAISAVVLTVALFKVSKPEVAAGEKQNSPNVIAEKKEPEKTTFGSGYSTMQLTPDSVQPIAGLQEEETEKSATPSRDGLTATSGDVVATGSGVTTTSVNDGTLNLRKENADKQTKREMENQKAPTGENVTYRRDEETVADSISFGAVITKKEDKSKGKGLPDDKSMNEEDLKNDSADYWMAQRSTMSNTSAGSLDNTVRAYKDIPRTSAEEMPVFPGGEEALTNYFRNNMKYPEKSMKDSVEGKVYFSFVIGTSGKVKEIAVIQGVNKEINAEAIRLVANMPKWEPGKDRGQAVAIQLFRTIEFKIEEQPGRKSSK